MVNKIGRNQLCPCGSGAKYKKCCLARERVQLQHQQTFRRALDDYKNKSKTEEGEKEAVQISTDGPQSTEEASDQDIRDERNR